MEVKNQMYPSTADVPNGRGTAELYGPNMAQMLFAAVTAAAAVLKPPSV